MHMGVNQATYRIAVAFALPGTYMYVGMRLSALSTCTKTDIRQKLKNSLGMWCGVSCVPELPYRA
jgi:hypothetical protein